jgi:hypothetical protein
MEPLEQGGWARAQSIKCIKSWSRTTKFSTTTTTTTTLSTTALQNQPSFLFNHKQDKMQFTTSALVALLAYTSSTAASPVQARQTTLKDFEVSSVTVFTPSGRPGSYPWATITANVTDPNEIDLGTASSDGSPVTVPAGSQGLVRFRSDLKKA